MGEGSKSNKPLSPLSTCVKLVPSQISQSSDKLKLDNSNEIIPDMKNQDCEMIVVPIATNLMDLDHAQPLAETNYSAVSHSGNDFGQLDGIQVAAGLGHATAAAGPARKNNNMPSTPLRIDEAAPAVTSTITSSAAAAAPRNNPKQPFSKTVITSNNFSSKSFDDSNKMNKISNNMNLTSITIDYNNFNYYPMTTSNATTLIKPSDDNEMKNELNTDEDDVID